MRWGWARPEETATTRPTTATAGGSTARRRSLEPSTQGCPTWLDTSAYQKIFLFRPISSARVLFASGIKTISLCFLISALIWMAGLHVLSCWKSCCLCLFALFASVWPPHYLCNFQIGLVMLVNLVLDAQAKSLFLLLVFPKEKKIQELTSKNAKFPGATTAARTGTPRDVQRRSKCSAPTRTRPSLTSSTSATTPAFRGRRVRLPRTRRRRSINTTPRVSLVPQNFAKFFKILRHIESLDVCIKH